MYDALSAWNHGMNMEFIRIGIYTDALAIDIQKDQKNSEKK
jgi:hypothetical protein